MTTRTATAANLPSFSALLGTIIATFGATESTLRFFTLVSIVANSIPGCRLTVAESHISIDGSTHFALEVRDGLGRGGIVHVDMDENGHFSNMFATDYSQGRVHGCEEDPNGIDTIHAYLANLPRVMGCTHREVG